MFAPLPTKTKYYKDEIIKELNLTAVLSDKLLKTQDKLFKINKSAFIVKKSPKMTSSNNPTPL